MSGDAGRFHRAIDSIDAANARDPVTVSIRGEVRPRELAHAALASEWIGRLVQSPSEALRLATRAHHVRRWEVPRSDYPEGRAGYRRWRKRAQAFHADVAGEILVAAGYEAQTVDRVGEIVRKERPETDAEVQALEDALCLVFLETELESTAEKLADEEKLVSVLGRTLVKMSPAALALAEELPLEPDQRELLQRARS